MLFDRDWPSSSRAGNQRGNAEIRISGKVAHGGSWGALTTVSILRFARDVQREVPCDYDPRYPAATPEPNRWAPLRAGRPTGQKSCTMPRYGRTPKLNPVAELTLWPK